MTKVEDALRRALTDQPPSSGTGHVLAHVEGVLKRRQHVRRFAAAAAVAAMIAGATGGGLWASMHQRPRPSRPVAAMSPGVVPWVDTAGTPGHVSQPLRSAPSGAVWPACEPTVLRASYGSTTAWAGTSGVSLAVTNTGAHGCILSGAPTAVSLVGRDGRTVAVKGHPVSAASVQLRAPAALSPGQQAQFVLASSDMCGKPGTGFRAIRFHVASGPWMSVTVPDRGTLALPCARWFSAFGLSTQPTNPVKANPLHALKVTSSMPATVAAGASVHFQLTLTNPTDHTVALAPCPSYAEFLAPAGTNPHARERTYRLNCAGAGGHIPPHSKIVFAMQVRAPRAPGEAKFGWTINNAGLTTGRTLTVANP